MPTETIERIKELVNEKLLTWLETSLTHIPEFIVAILILCMFYIVARLVGGLLNRVFHRTMESTQVASLLLTIIRVIIIGLGCFIALDFIGLKGTVTSLLAGAGIIGLALGFAFQDLTENFIAGVVMGIRKPFRIGDVIESAGVLGIVQSLNFRNTIVETFSGQLEIVPNKHLFRNILRNYSYSGVRRIDIPVGISYADDVEKAHKFISEKVNELDGVIRKDETSAYADSFGDSSVNLTVRFWIRYPDSDFLKIRHEAVAAIHKAIEENDMVIPFPIRTLDFGIKGGKTLSENVIHVQSQDNKQD